MTDAEAAVARAEAEPLLGHRTQPVRAAIDAAARAVDAAPDPLLRARVMLRLAQVALAEADLDAADRALAAALRDAPDGSAAKLVIGLRGCRVAIRRGAEPRAIAGATLVAAASRLDRAAPPVAIELAIAIGELELHAAEPDPVAFATLAALGDELAGDPAHVDAVFAARQLCAAHALMRGELEPAARALRAIVALAKDAGSPADEIEARLALAAALVEARDPIGLQEAGRLVELARDRAREHGLVQLGDAARIAQAGVLAATGKTGAALDRVLELARAAAANHDVAQYVAAVGIMAELYARTGDHVSAFRTIAEAHRALADATGQDATPLFRPLLARLRDRVGAARLEQIAADVDRANRLAAELRRPEPSDRE